MLVISMTNEQLRVLVAVVEQGSFRKAAKSIYKTQAAVSAAIKTLEDEFGLELFDRSHYRPQLTTAGEAFYQRAKLTMDHFQQLNIMGHQLASSVEPRFGIVISASCPLPSLLKKLKHVIDSFPYTRFHITTEVLNGVVEPINSGEADLAFGAEFGLNTSHEKIPVEPVAFINVAAPGYFKTTNQRDISLEEAREYDQIALRDSAKRSDKASMYVSPSGESWSVSDMATKKDLTLAGLGWGRLPEHLIRQELASGLLEPIDVESIPRRTEAMMYMFRKRDSQKGPVAERVWHELIQAYKVTSE